MKTPYFLHSAPEGEIQLPPFHTGQSPDGFTIIHQKRLYVNTFSENYALVPVESVRPVSRLTGNTGHKTSYYPDLSQLIAADALFLRSDINMLSMTIETALDADASAEK